MVTKPRTQMKKLAGLKELFRQIDGTPVIDANGPMTVGKLIASTLASARVVGIDAMLAMNLAGELYENEEDTFLITEEKLGIINKSAENQVVELPVLQKYAIFSVTRSARTVEVAETKSNGLVKNADKVETAESK